MYLQRISVFFVFMSINCIAYAHGSGTWTLESGQYTSKTHAIYIGDSKKVYRICVSGEAEHEIQVKSHDDLIIEPGDCTDVEGNNIVIENRINSNTSSGTYSAIVDE